MSEFRTNHGAQWPLASMQVIKHDMTLTFDGSSQLLLFKLPQNAIFLRGDFNVITAYDDTAVAPLFGVGTVGDTTLMGTAISPKSAGVTALTGEGFKTVSGENIYLLEEAALNGDGTQGEINVHIEYLVEGRANEVQTH